MNSKRKPIVTILLISFLCSMLLSVNVGATNTSTADQATKQTSVSWPSGPSVVAEGAIVMEASTGMILYQKNIDKKLYPASITKIMTTLLAVENSSLSEVLTFSSDAMFSIEPGSSHVGGTVGEQMTMEQALYCVMLESANEVSSAVGEHVAGSLDDFAKMMTERAKEIGCKNTNFANAHGLHDDNHYTTPYDMALITRTAMQNQTFRTIAGTKRFIIPPTNKKVVTRYLTNHQQMITGNKYPQYLYDYAIAGKTGYTSKAGNTLVTVANKDGLELICVVMKSKPPTQSQNLYTDTISLLDFAFENYKVYNIDEEASAPTIDDNLLFTRYNALFNEETAPIYVGGNNSVVLPVTASLDDVTQSIEYYDNVDLSNGQAVIGSITYTLDNKVVGSSNILYKKQITDKLETVNEVIQKKSPSKTLSELLGISGNGFNNPILVCVIVVIIIATLFVFLMVLKKRHRKSRKNQYIKNKRTKTFTNLHDKFMKYH